MRTRLARGRERLRSRLDPVEVWQLRIGPGNRAQPSGDADINGGAGFVNDRSIAGMELGRERLGKGDLDRQKRCNTLCSGRPHGKPATLGRMDPKALPAEKVDRIGIEALLPESKR